MSVALSTLSFGVGSIHYDVALGGRLPYRIDADAIEMHVPTDCPLCKGCIPGASELKNIVLSSVARVLQPPALPTSLIITTTTTTNAAFIVSCLFLR